MEPSTLDSICAHLEFLGYKINKQEKSIQAEGQARPRFVAFNERAGGIAFSALYSMPEATKANRAAFLEWVNKINLQTVVATVFANQGGDLYLSAWFPGRYEKEAFGNFFELFRQDVNGAVNNPEFQQSFGG